MTFGDYIAIIKKARSTAILPHISVDGDGLGSSLALALSFEKMGIEAVVFIEEPVPFTFQYLPGFHLLKVYDAQDPKKSFHELSHPLDLIISLDTGDLERLGTRKAIFESTDNTINMDHHSTNTRFASMNYVNAEYAATGEIMYVLIKEMGIEIDRPIAECLYTAITTDTGGFRFSNTTALSHQIAAELISCGVEVAEVSRRVFETMSISKAKLIGRATASLQLYENGAVAMMMVTEDMMRSVGAQDGDCDGIVNIARNIRGVEVGVMLKQKDDNEVRVNLRSNIYVDVAAIAQAFAGGGHKRAAGCTITGSMQEVQDMIQKEIRKVLL